MIREVREWRELHSARGRAGNKGAQIEAAACAIREKALLDARAAVVGKVEAGYAFRSVLR